MVCHGALRRHQGEITFVVAGGNGMDYLHTQTGTWLNNALWIMLYMSDQDHKNI